MKKLTLNHLEIASITLSELEIVLTEMINQDKASLVLTYNMAFLKNAETNSYFRDISQNADLILPDGSGIIFLLKVKYGNRVNRITGTDVFNILLKAGNKLRLNIAFLGSDEEVLCRVKEKIKGSYPAINIVSSISPPFLFEKNKEQNKKVIEELIRAKPHILIAALGNPRQEIWLAENMEKIGAKINVGVGAVFDFYSGRKKRAPVFIQNVGMEWLWRLSLEPKRLFKRYFFANAFFLQTLTKLLFDKIFKKEIKTSLRG
ncbi:MAG: WecB/TagA/CpsF family glycosyltransferase [Ignavibacteriaceae bacterium]